MIARLVVFALIAALAIGGVGAAIGSDGDDELAALEEIELRKDDASGEVELVGDEGDDDQTGDRDNTRGDDGTNAGHNTGDGDGTDGNDGTGHGDNTPDGDGTRGNDGTGGGDGTGNDASAGFGGDDTLGGGGASFEGDTAPPAAAPAPAPAPAPVYDDYSDDGGAYYGTASGDGDT
jgi:hypothetical protein